MARLIELVQTECQDYKKGYFSFSMLDTNPEIDFLKKEFKERFNAEDMPFLNIPPAIMVHAGPGTIIVTFFTA